MNAVAPDIVTLSGVVVVVLVNYLRPHQGWGWMRLMQGPGALRDVPGLAFAKVMGSGHGGGFGLRPSATHQGLIALFDHADQATAFLQGDTVAAMRERAGDCWRGVLEVVSARGQWDGQAWGPTSAEQLGAWEPAANDDDGDPRPLAVLTRASIRPAKAMAFWRNAPPAQNAMLTAPGCRLAMGLGEAPLVRQCTFSVWDDTPAMLAYAHAGAHRAAIEAAHRQQYFAESLFARFRVLHQEGQWPAPHTLPQPTGVRHD